MPKKLMGYEGQIFYGAAGATAATLISNSGDINYELDYDEGDTTERGDGTAPPIETARVTVRKVSALSWTMLNKEGDTTLTSLLTAAYAATPVAIRTKDKAAGKGFDGDVYLKVKHGKPLRGQQTFEFTAKPTDELRTPQLYV